MGHIVADYLSLSILHFFPSICFIEAGCVLSRDLNGNFWPKMESHVLYLAYIYIYLLPAAMSYLHIQSAE